MNCRRARHLLFDFFDGASSEALRAEVDRHLGVCADCEKFASEMSQSLALLRRTPVEPLDDTFNWKVRLAIHRERNAALSRARSAGAWVRMWNVRYAVSSGLAFGAVLVAGAFLIRDGSVTTPERLVTPGTEITQNSEPSGPSPVPHSNMSAPARDGISSLVSAGSARVHGPAPQGPIDKTEAESRIDSLINVDVMRMSDLERERYMQRRIENMRRLREFLQSQQPAPAQR